jgi:hypothetical protein
MTLNEFKKAIDILFEQGIEADEPVCIEVEGRCFEVISITVVVQSDIWVPETVVVTGALINSDGEADDG